MFTVALRASSRLCLRLRTQQYVGYGAHDLAGGACSCVLQSVAVRKCANAHWSTCRSARAADHALLLFACGYSLLTVHVVMYKCYGAGFVGAHSTVSCLATQKTPGVLPVAAAT